MKTITAAEGISPEYLSDESRFTGAADAISFPEDSAELVDLVGRLARGAAPFTVQGARTGITGGAVSEGGHIVNLSKMNRITGLGWNEAADSFSITVEPGLALADLHNHLARRDFGAGFIDPASERAFERFRNEGKFFFPPDPTETTATLGGMAACNASGARSFRYGPMRLYVRALDLVLASGDAVRLERGGLKAAGRAFSLPLATGAVLSGMLPAYQFPRLKNAAGYFAADDMELIDLFIGAEGTLGVISSLTLAIVRQPAFTVGVLFFFKSEPPALEFVRRVKHRTRAIDTILPCAIEYFDQGALAIVRTLSDDKLRQPDPAHAAAVYVEADGGDEDRLFGYFEGLAAEMAGLGEDPDANWTGTDEREREALRLFRHAVPEAVNLAIAAYKREAPGITKLGTDFAVPEGKLGELVAVYRAALDPAGLQYVMFGHIGDNHLHVNILPRTGAEYAAGKTIYRRIAETAVAMGGTVSAEHGIGKLKRDYLSLMYGEAGIEEMKRVKRLFDPGYLLNRGNLFTLP
jgi:D-lactate dehydrogenase (cytochrome)